jgi:DNA polymerase III delta prime subunit
VDEQTTALVEALAARMERESELFLVMGREVDRLRDSVQEKKWGQGLAIAQGLERFAGKVEEADTARDGAYAALCSTMGIPPDSVFSILLSRVSAEQRNLLENRWRSLRTSVIHLGTASNRLRYYAEALGGTLGRVLEEIFPHRRGRIYSRRGTATSVNDSLLVDRKL